jgi:hypothetical protein
VVIELISPVLVSCTKKNLATLVVSLKSSGFETRSYFFSTGINDNVPRKQGCQMVYFRTKNPNFGIFWRVLQWKLLVYFMAIWSIFRPFWYILWRLGIFCNHLVIFPVLVYCTTKNLATLPGSYTTTTRNSCHHVSALSLEHLTLPYPIYVVQST